MSFLSKYSTRDPGEIAIAGGVKGGNILTILVEKEHEVKPPPSTSYLQWLDMHDWKQQLKSGSAWEEWYRAKLAEIVSVVESDVSRRFAGEIKALEESLKRSNHRANHPDISSPRGRCSKHPSVV